MINSNACGDCRNCCTDTLVRVTDEDIKRWKKEQRYDIILSLERMFTEAAYLVHKKDSEECISLGEKGCTIYRTRPEICRKFPSSEYQKKRYSCRLE